MRTLSIGSVCVALDDARSAEDAAVDGGVVRASLLLFVPFSATLCRTQPFDSHFVNIIVTSPLFHRSFTALTAHRRLRACLGEASPRSQLSSIEAYDRDRALEQAPG